jgi:hypothetical protein
VISVAITLTAKNDIIELITVIVGRKKKQVVIIIQKEKIFKIFVYIIFYVMQVQRHKVELIRFIFNRYWFKSCLKTGKIVIKKIIFKWVL